MLRASRLHRVRIDHPAPRRRVGERPEKHNYCDEGKGKWPAAHRPTWSYEPPAKVPPKAALAPGVVLVALGHRLSPRWCGTDLASPTRSSVARLVGGGRSSFSYSSGYPRADVYPDCQLQRCADVDSARRGTAFQPLLTRGSEDGDRARHALVCWRRGIVPHSWLASGSAVGVFGCPACAIPTPRRGVMGCATSAETADLVVSTLIAIGSAVPRPDARKGQGTPA